MTNKSPKDAINMLYSERKDFIIIGLTGRTGAGCSTVASLLAKDFEKLNPPKPKEYGFDNNEERKYRVVYKYAQVNWRKFIIIRVRDIITSFVLEQDFNNFIILLEKYKDSILGYKELIKELSSLKEQYNLLHNKIIEIKKNIDEGNEYRLSADNIYKTYFEDLNSFTDSIQEIFNKYEIYEHKASLFTYLYQIFGNNIRKSGSVYNEEFYPEKIFTLSYRINLIIKLLRKMNIKSRKGVTVVIDALRNPYEVSFFKDRYSAFYLFSINTNDGDRVRRLIKKGFSDKQIETLDDQEYPEKKGNEQFSSQNIQKCIELSDIYLYNPDERDKNFNFLKKQIVKYVSLIMHPGLVTPTHEERCMQVAYICKLNSGCISRQVGAAVTDSNYSIKAIGWNSVPEGQVPCNLRDLTSMISGFDKEAFSCYETDTEEYKQHIKEKIEGKIDCESLNGRIFSYCFKDAYNSYEQRKNQVHTRALHAEENAFLQISKYGGVGLKGGFLFTTASPCELCAKKAYQLGIKKIYYIDPYPGISRSHVFNCGSNKPELILYKGAIGRAYAKLYEQIIPYKDELYLLTSIKF